MIGAKILGEALGLRAPITLACPSMFAAETRRGVVPLCTPGQHLIGSAHPRNAMLACGMIRSREQGSKGSWGRVAVLQGCSAMAGARAVSLRP